MDGARLVTENGTGPWAPGNNMRTEIDTFSRIRVSGTLEEPSFIMYTRDNRILKYGFSSRSRSITSTNKIQEWLLESVEDYTNNKIFYNYEFDNGVAYIQNITYFGVGIKFQYEFRVDIRETYYAGFKQFSVNKRLFQVSSFVRNGEFIDKTLHLKYSNVKYPGYQSVLEKVLLCSSKNCLKPLNLDYDGLTLEKLGELKPVSWQLEDNVYFLNCQLKVFVDFNNDGLNDLARFCQEGLFVSLQNINGSFGTGTCWVRENFLNYYSKGIKLADYNGDGFIDFVASNGNNNLYFFENTGSDSLTNRGSILSGWSLTNFDAKDANGDGKIDIIGIIPSGVAVGINNGTGSFSFNSYLGYFGWNQFNGDYLRIFEDVNKDSLPDAILFGPNSIFVALNPGTGAYSTYSSWLNNNFTFNDNWRISKNLRILCDMNSDGLPDIVGIKENLQVSKN